MQLHLADDALPFRGQLKADGSFDRGVGDDDLGHPIDPEGPLALVGLGHQVPDVVLVDQSQRVDKALGALVGPIRIIQPDF